MASEDTLWAKLLEFNLVRLNPESEQELKAFSETLSNHTGEFLFFNIHLNMVLWNYQTISNYKKENGYINFNYIFNCDLILIALVSSLESYLERSFMKISKKLNIKDLNKETFKKFLKEYNLKKPETDKINLLDILPNIMYFQQKDKAKIAYKLINIYLPSVADEKQSIWNKIFGEQNGYIALRHSAIHAGLINSILKHTNDDNVVNLRLINRATLDVSKFIFKLDKTILNEFPKSEYPELYAQEVQD